MESLGRCFGYVKIPQCGYKENGSENITLYVQKHIAPLVGCSGSPLVRDKPLGAPVFVTLAYYNLTLFVP